MMESYGTPTIILSHSLKAMPVLMLQYCLIIWLCKKPEDFESRP